MSALPVASYLIDFGRDGDFAAAATALRGRQAAPDADAARIEAAHASGFESGKAAGRAELERKLEEQKAGHEAQLARARRTWASEEGSKLAEQLSGGLREVETAIADAAARILHPFLAAAVREQAIASLRAELEVLLQKDAGIQIGVSGPEDLLHAVRAQLAGRTEAVTYLPGEGIDVRVSVGRTVIETRLKTWLEKIQEAMR